MNIYVGNLPFTTGEADLRTEFESFGGVTNVKIVTDRETGRPRGFAFVEMEDDNEGRAAIDALNNKEIGGRILKVDEARSQQRGGVPNEGRW